MTDIIRVTVTFVLSNYSLSFFVLGLIVSLAAIFRTRHLIDRREIVEKLISWYIFFSIGLGNFYNFVIHAFFGDVAASLSAGPTAHFNLKSAWRASALLLSASWPPSEVSTFVLRPSLGPEFSCSVPPAGHVRQMVIAHNFAPGNAGVVFGTDIFIPLFGFLLLYLQCRNSKSRQIDTHRCCMRQGAHLSCRVAQLRALRWRLSHACYALPLTVADTPGGIR
jgi:hypothetical protein